jgi:hypothetical protein
VLADWNLLSDNLQLTVAQEALAHAAERLAVQAELLATEMEAGALADRGGPAALRLFAAVARINGKDRLMPAGHA